jgi:radical SAM superfamily enzyme YgiQ (UPF0313 family)
MPWLFLDYAPLGVNRLQAVLEKNNFPTTIRYEQIKMKYALKEFISWKQFQRFMIKYPNLQNSVYASLLFPTERHRILSYTRSKLPKDDMQTISVLMNQGIKIAQTLKDRLVADLTRDNPYRLIGFSIGWSQVIPSLYMAKIIKSEMPDIPIIFGGSYCSASRAKALFEIFPFADMYCYGEGEHTLLEIVRRLHEEKNIPLDVKGTGIRDNEDKTSIKINPPPPPVDLNSLPFPDFHDYLQQLTHVDRWLFSYPIELSRGCSWGKCSFCVGYKIHGMGPDHKFRGRNAESIYSEIKMAAEEYTPEKFFPTDTDTLGNRDEIGKLCSMIIQGDSDGYFLTELFGEARVASLTPSILKKMKRAGFETIQIGIEALAPEVLKKIRKGVKVIQNIYALRRCYENNVGVEFNLISHFPTETVDDIIITFQNLKKIAIILSHPNIKVGSITKFRLMGGSRVYNYPEKYNVAEIIPYRNWVVSAVGPTTVSDAFFFPSHLLKNPDLFFSYYYHQINPPPAPEINDLLWKHISEFASSNQIDHFHVSHFGKKLRVEWNWTPNKEIEEFARKVIILDELETALLHFCLEIRTKSVILANFPDKAPRILGRILTEMVQEGLLFQEGEEYVSLIPLNCECSKS